MKDNHTNKSSTTSQASIEILLSSISDVVRYSVQKKRYECALIVQEQMRKVRETTFRANANECTEITLQLQMLKTKLEILELEIEKYPEDTRDVWQPLINELNSKIGMMRQLRSKTKFL